MIIKSLLIYTESEIIKKKEILMKLVVNKELLLTKYRSEYETFDNTTGNTVAESQDLHTFHHVLKMKSTHQMQDPNMLWFEKGQFHVAFYMLSILGSIIHIFGFVLRPSIISTCR